MRGLVFEGGKLRYAEDLSDPVPAEGEALIQVQLAGICATDLEICKGYMNFEGVLGHEFLGRVEAPGDPAWHGTRVVGGINCACGKCDSCLQGLERHCPHRSVLGILNKSGAFAERITLPWKNLVPVPDKVLDEDVVYAEPLAAVLRMAEQFPMDPEERIAVLGDGRLGLLAAGAGVELGWKVSLVGKHDEKMNRIPGVESCFKPGEAAAASFDMAVDCTGSPDGMDEALRLLKPQGKLFLKTTVAGDRPLDLNRLVIDEITMIGSRCGPMDRAVEFLAQGRFKPSVLTSARFPLSKGVEAFEAAGESAQIKVLLDVAGSP
ncbi:MAG: MDR/zinc-dependent alcohol dehydrogenase-like family protein [Planctomycetota bacterium]